MIITVNNSSDMYLKSISLLWIKLLKILRICTQLSFDYSNVYFKKWNIIPFKPVFTISQSETCNLRDSSYFDWNKMLLKVRLYFIQSGYAVCKPVWFFYCTSLTHIWYGGCRQRKLGILCKDEIGNICVNGHWTNNKNWIDILGNTLFVLFISYNILPQRSCLIILQKHLSIQKICNSERNFNERYNKFALDE